MRQLNKQFLPEVFIHCENVIYGIGRGFVRKRMNKKQKNQSVYYGQAQILNNEISNIYHSQFGQGK